MPFCLRLMQGCFIIALYYRAASLQGAHFAQDDVNRPGVSQIFFDHAKEERDHAIKLADYLSLRGDTDTNYLQAAYVSHLPPVLAADRLRLYTEGTKHGSVGRTSARFYSSLIR